MYQKKVSPRRCCRDCRGCGASDKSPCRLKGRGCLSPICCTSATNFAICKKTCYFILYVLINFFAAKADGIIIGRKIFRGWTEFVECRLTASSQNKYERSIGGREINQAAVGRAVGKTELDVGAIPSSEGTLPGSGCGIAGGRKPRNNRDY